MKCTVGIVTSYRSEIYINSTIKSLEDAGWSEYTIFAEPDSYIPSTNNIVIRRPKQYGDWTNWCLGLYELLLSNPESDYFLMCEDDFVVSKNSRTYIEYALSFLGDFASISLFTSKELNKKNFVGFHNEARGIRTLGTVANIFKKEVLIQFFSDKEVQSHRFYDIFNMPSNYWSCDKTDSKNSLKDAVLGIFADKYNLPIYYHTPSLAQHIGTVSTISSKDEKETRFSDNVCEDCISLLANKVSVLKFNECNLL